MSERLRSSSIASALSPAHVGLAIYELQRRLNGFPHSSFVITMRLFIVAWNHCANRHHPAITLLLSQLRKWIGKSASRAFLPLLMQLPRATFTRIFLLQSHIILQSTFLVKPDFSRMQVEDH